MKISEQAQLTEVLIRKTWRTSVTHDVDQSLTVGTPSIYVAFNTELWDDPNNTMHSTTVNNSRVYVQYPGLYLITAHLQFLSAHSTILFVYPRLVLTWSGGTKLIGSAWDEISLTTNMSILTMHAQYIMHPGDYVQIYVTCYGLTGAETCEVQAVADAPSLAMALLPG